MENLLTVNNLRISYHSYAGEVQAVRGVSFDVKKGETVALVGESGCGKSVTARSIMGLIQTPPGEIKQYSEIIHNGRNILDFSEQEWRVYRGAECSIVFQDAMTSLNPTMSIGNQIAESLTIHLRLSKHEAIKETANILELVGISNPAKRFKQYPHEFSGGMRQRAMIAIALACKPQLLIADEPTTALDVTIQAQILDLLKNLQHKLLTSIIMITHDLGVVAGMAQKVVVMYSGQAVERGTAEDIFYRPKHPYTLALLKSVPNPNLKNKQLLTVIEGAPPMLINPPQGCSFAERCSYCMNICDKSMPPEHSFTAEHSAACWLHHPMAS